MKDKEIKSILISKNYIINITSKTHESRFPALLKDYINGVAKYMPEQTFEKIKDFLK